jgi:hypothetical protein
MAHPDEALVRRGYEAFNTGDVATLQQVCRHDDLA